MRLMNYQPRRLSPPSRPLAGWLPALYLAVLPLCPQHLRDTKEAGRGRDGRKADKREDGRGGAGRSSETTTPR
jgi:hypothetical protein